MCYKVLICRSEEQESRAGFLGSAPASVWFFNLFPLVDLECEKWISVPLKRLRETICLFFRLPRNNSSSGWAGLISPHRRRHDGSFFFSNDHKGRSGLVTPSPLLLLHYVAFNRLQLRRRDSTHSPSTARHPRW
jgi:hypothetical protein